MNNQFNYILRMRVDVTSYDDVTKRVIEWIKLSYGRYICLANVHMCMETYDDKDFLKVVNQADLVVPDGRPIVWALQRLGNECVSQVRGTDLFNILCKEAEKQGVTIGLYGGTNHSLRDIGTYLNKKFPSLQIVANISPPYRNLTDEENDAYVKQINDSGSRILLVGLGCPKQESWMAAHKDRINCVMIGVGAAFDFISGRKKSAPRLMQQCGIEWFYRLVNEPLRLWKRYVKHNPRFIWLFFKQLLAEKKYS
jgi:N-acetylglucosaminyldiphosphoundecaprenol N-acetyl-beta-D-mannosaminyltransferase